MEKNRLGIIISLDVQLCSLSLYARLSFIPSMFDDIIRTARATRPIGKRKEILILRSVQF